MYTMKECDTNNKHEPLVQGPSIYYLKEILDVIEDMKLSVLDGSFSLN